MTDLIAAVSEAIVAICAEEMVPRFRALNQSEIGTKDGGDVVTIVDTICEQRLKATLTDLLPGSVTVGEEEVAANPALLDRLEGQDDVWLIDPLDGTKNFAAGPTISPPWSPWCGGRKWLAAGSICRQPA